MKKRLPILICLIGILLFLGVSFVLAQCFNDATVCIDPGNPSAYCENPCREDPANPGSYIGLNHPLNQICMCSPLGSTNIEDLLDSVINYIFWFATAITPILIISGAFVFMTSAGNIEKVNTAKKIMTYTVIGYAIILFSRGLIAILANILGQSP